MPSDQELPVATVYEMYSHNEQIRSNLQATLRAIIQELEEVTCAVVTLSVLFGPDGVNLSQSQDYEDNQVYFDLFFKLMAQKKYEAIAIHNSNEFIAEIQDSNTLAALILMEGLHDFTASHLVAVLPEWEFTYETEGGTVQQIFNVIDTRTEEIINFIDQPSALAELYAQALFVKPQVPLSQRMVFVIKRSQLPAYEYPTYSNQSLSTPETDD